MASSATNECRVCTAMFRTKEQLTKHLRDSPGCKAGFAARHHLPSHGSPSCASSSSSSSWRTRTPPATFKCSTCLMIFPAKSGLTDHLHRNPSCRTKPNLRDPHLFTHEIGQVLPSAAYSKTVPDTLLAAMEDGLKKKPAKSGASTSILCAIAEGDDDLTDAYLKLSLDPVSGARKLSKDIVGLATKKALINVDTIAKLLSQAQNVSICFVLDTTGSMKSYIKGVKDQILDIVRLVEASSCVISGVAFVGYKEWYNGDYHFEVLPFTNDIARFETFVAAIRAGGGCGNWADVLGGLDQAVKLNWPEKSASRILFHLGDEPPHGRGLFHDHYHDVFPNGHPRDRPLGDLFEEVRNKRVDYYFGRINDHCDRMVTVFEEAYGRRIDKMDSLKASTICETVTSSIMKTVSATCSSTLSSVKLNRRHLRKFTLDVKEPDWATVEVLDGTIMTFQLPDTIDAITSFSKLEEKVKKCRLQIAPNPFATGAVRLAYHAKILFGSTSDSDLVDDVVCKEFMTLPNVEFLDRQRYMCDLEVQTIASKLALDFNERLSRTTKCPEFKIKFLMAKVIRTTMSTGSTPRFMAYEKRFRGDYNMVKYTNNKDFVLDGGALDADDQTKLKLVLAFSHFSFDVTSGYLLVCDLQGVSTEDYKGKPTVLLTDPAIHCAKHLRFGKTNLRDYGIKSFFKKHVCNEYCKALGLAMPK